MTDYKPRIVDTQLEKLLKIMPAVLIDGAKFSGKTETARQHTRSEVLLDVDQNARILAEVHPAGLLAGATPRLLDEWQVVPNIWNHVRRVCDDRNQPGQFLLTGSSSPSEDQIRHSGAGRVSRLQMRPMSLYEQGLSDGSISLQSMLMGEKTATAKPNVSFEDIVKTLCRGGWPLAYDLTIEEALEYNRAYLNEISRGELSGSGSHDARRMRRLITSIARNISTQASMTTLRNDVDATMQVATISNYLDFLQRIHIVEEQTPFKLHLRSRAQLRVTPKRHFCDPALAVAATRSSPSTLLSNMNYVGLLFESMVIRDLHIYSEVNDAQVYFYRDNTGLEIDAVIETAVGEWIAAEVKLGGETLIESAVKNLLKFQQKIESKTQSSPANLLVITATPEFAHNRPDGISVVPITSLGP